MLPLTDKNKNLARIHRRIKTGKARYREVVQDIRDKLTLRENTNRPKGARG